MISFRLPNDQYERFRDLCYSQGMRSVSELARAAICRLIAEPDQGLVSREVLESRVASLEAQLSQVAQELKKLRKP
jgi:Arc/MetJ-type ribon-helix-helix transcriptional regulator